MNVQEASKTSVSIVVTPNYKKKQLDSEIIQNAEPSHEILKKLKKSSVDADMVE